MLALLGGAAAIWGVFELRARERQARLFAIKAANAEHDCCWLTPEQKKRGGMEKHFAACEAPLADARELAKGDDDVAYVVKTELMSVCPALGAAVKPPPPRPVAPPPPAPAAPPPRDYAVLQNRSTGQTWRLEGETSLNAVALVDKKGRLRALGYQELGPGGECGELRVALTDPQGHVQLELREGQFRQDGKLVSQVSLPDGGALGIAAEGDDESVIRYAEVLTVLSAETESLELGGQRILEESQRCSGLGGADGGAFVLTDRLEQHAVLREVPAGDLPWPPSPQPEEGDGDYESPGFSRTARSALQDTKSGATLDLQAEAGWDAVAFVRPDGGLAAVGYKLADADTGCGPPEVAVLRADGGIGLVLKMGDEQARGVKVDGDGETSNAWWGALSISWDAEMPTSLRLRGEALLSDQPGLDCVRGARPVTGRFALIDPEGQQQPVREIPLDLPQP